MHRSILSILIAVIFYIPAAVSAATLEELVARYDKNRNGKLDGDEVLIYQAHQNDPVLAKFDLNNDGKLDDKERALAVAAINDYAKRPSPINPSGNKPEDIFNRGLQRLNAKNPGIPLGDLAEKPKTLANPCDTQKLQNLYIRKDNFDTYLYGITPVSKAQGASVSYTTDYLTPGQRTAQIDGIISYVAWRDPCLGGARDSRDQRPYISGLAIAPWVSGHGTLNDRSRDKEKNALKFGLDSQWDVSDGKIFDVHYFAVTPYWQTDFRGIARAEGVTAFWEPYLLDPKWRLGGSYSRFSEYLDWYWRFRAELDVKKVEVSGPTNFALGYYEWLGFTSQLYLLPFPGTLGIPEHFRDRMKLTGTLKYYTDLRSGIWISQFSGEVAYNLSSDGSTSISLGYDRGINKDTLVALRQYLVKLNYKY